jgi:hypothetical protein
MKFVVGLLVVAVAATASAQSKSADEHEKELADQRAKALEACLARPPINAMHVIQTNPFLSYKSTFESLLHQARDSCAPPEKWRECMDSLAMQAMWSPARDAAAAQHQLADRTIALARSIPIAPDCNFDSVEDAHVVCMNSGRDACIPELIRDAHQMQCSWDLFEKVVIAEDEDRAKQAKQAQDAQCRNADAQQAAADQKTIEGERNSEAEQRKREEEQQKKDEEAKEQADAQREADEQKREDDRKAAEAKRQAEIERRKRIHERYEEEVQTANAQNAQNAAQIGAVMGSLSGGGNKPYGPGTFRHFELGMGFEMVPIEGVRSGSDVMTGSTGTFGFGLGFQAGLEYAPLHRSWLTLGGYGELTTGGMALPGGSAYVVDVDGGLFGSIGPEAGASLVARFGFGFRIAGNSSDTGAGIIDSTTIASDAYSYEKLRAGIRWCTHAETTNKAFCESSIELRVGTDLHADLGSPIVLGLEYSIRRFLSIGAEVGIQYPRDTTAATTTTMPFDDPGVLVGFHITHSWDHFSGAPPAPVVEQVATTEETAANEEPDASERGSDGIDAGSLSSSRWDERATPPPAVQPEPLGPQLAHERHRWALGAAAAVDCYSLHGNEGDGVDYGGCGLGLRAIGDMPYGDFHVEVLAAGFGGKGIGGGIALGSGFHAIGATSLALAVRATGDFGVGHYEASGAPCPVLQYEPSECTSGSSGVASGWFEAVSFGGVLAGSYTLPGAHSIEGGVGAAYMLVPEVGADDAYRVGTSDGWVMRFFAGARL